MAKLAPLKVLCFSGAEEDDSLCPLLPTAAATRVELAGGHHFDGDYDGIGRRILDELH